jgi:hypothetical protein
VIIKQRRYFQSAAAYFFYIYNNSCMGWMQIEPIGQDRSKAAHRCVRFGGGHFCNRPYNHLAQQKMLKAERTGTRPALNPSGSGRRSPWHRQHMAQLERGAVVLRARRTCTDVRTAGASAARTRNLYNLKNTDSFHPPGKMSPRACDPLLIRQPTACLRSKKYALLNFAKFFRFLIISNL